MPIFRLQWTISSAEALHQIAANAAAAARKNAFAGWLGICCIVDSAVGIIQYELLSTLLSAFETENQLGVGESALLVRLAHHNQSKFTQNI